jgi:ubiquinone/menaquinone biosynthesis C-methylase UbiE
MTKTNYKVWKSKELVDKYLSDVRKAIPFANEQIEIILRIIDSCKISVKRILDLGCGDGILAAAIIQKNPNASGVLIDIAEPMIQAAKDKLSSYQDRFDFVVYDYGDKHWVKKVRAEEPFSVVVSGFSIHHQTDEGKRALYEEIFQLLEPGGVFLNLEHVSSATVWISSLFHEYFVDSLFDVHRRKRGGMTRDQVAQQYYCRDDKAANILAPVETQCEWLRNIGFKDVDCYFKIFELALFGGRRP